MSHAFIPIDTKDKALEAAAYISVQASKLNFRSLGLVLDIEGIAFYTHSDEEYAKLVEALKVLGESESNVMVHA